LTDLLFFNLLLRRVVSSHLVVVVVDVLEHVVARLVGIRHALLHGHVLVGGVAVVVVEVGRLEVVDRAHTLVRLLARRDRGLGVGSVLGFLCIRDAHPVHVFPVVIKIVLRLFPLGPHRRLLSGEFMVTHLAVGDSVSEIGTVISKFHEFDSVGFLVAKPSKSIRHHCLLVCIVQIKHKGVFLPRVCAT